MCNSLIFNSQPKTYALFLDSVQHAEQVLNASRRANCNDQTGLSGNHQLGSIVGSNVIAAQSAVVVHVVSVTENEIVSWFKM